MPAEDGLKIVGIELGIEQERDPGGSIFVGWITFSKTVLLVLTTCTRSCKIQTQAEYQRAYGGKEGRKSRGRNLVILRLGG